MRSDMQAEQSSRTALAATFFRAHDVAHHLPPVLGDKFAHRLLSPAEREFFESTFLAVSQLSEPALPTSPVSREETLSRGIAAAGMAATVLSRARYTEERLEEMVQGTAR